VEGKDRDWVKPQKIIVEFGVPAEIQIKRLSSLFLGWKRQNSEYPSKHIVRAFHPKLTQIQIATKEFAYKEAVAYEKRLARAKIHTKTP
jgi:hypothetical protein